MSGQYIPERVGERVAIWIERSKRGRLLLWILERLAAVVGAAATLLAFATLDTELRPVITDWKIDYIRAEPGGSSVVVGGTLRKRRACDHIATSVVAVPLDPQAARIPIASISPADIPGGDSPTGLTTWGPWSFRVPVQLVGRSSTLDRIEVVGIHHCHALWNHETVYGSVPVRVLLEAMKP